MIQKSIVLLLLNVWVLLTMLQILRIRAMKEERERQYKAGERSKEEHYANAPRIDAY
jgi:NADH:ubiquinone oxidoreductase subunit 3 (subunit A)